MAGLVDSLMGLVGPQVISALSSRVGESESAVRGGLQSSAATLLGSMASKAGDTGLMGQLFNMVTGTGTQGMLGNLTSLASSGPSGVVGELGSKFLGTLLGNQQSAAVDAISKSAGMRSSSASSILAMAAPLVMGFLGQRAKEGGLNPASFANMLSAELPSLKAMLPAGLGSIVTGLGSAVGAAAGVGSAAMSSAGSAASSTLRSTASVASSAVNTAADAGSSASRWVMPLLLGALALGGIYWFMNRGNQAIEVAKEATTAAGTAAKEAATTAGNAATGVVSALGEFFKRSLPNGVELNIPRLGVENRLIAFIEDKSKPVDKTTWFDFDRLLFDTGKASLQPSSQEQLANIAAVLKAYPGTNLKIGGYTDNTGVAAANLKLSADRANNVMAELVKLGVAPARLSAEGYGDQHPVADNATEEGRAKNRRIAMRVTQK